MNSLAGQKSRISEGELASLRAGLEHDGVGVLPGFIPAALCDAARGAIDDHLGITTDPASWYRHKPAPDGLLPLHHPQAFWDIRQHRPLYEVFRALIATPFLWVSMDRGSFKAPFRHNHPRERNDAPFHWEMDPRRPERRLQAMIYLETCRADQGPFRCVPGLFRQLEAWRAVYGVEPFPADRIRAEQILDITGTKGSLLVWDARLPAGSALNRSPVPRYSMMVTMLPEGDEERRAQRIEDFEAQRAPAWLRDGKSVSENHGPLKLTELGEQLLGRKPW